MKNSKNLSKGQPTVLNAPLFLTLETSDPQKSTTNQQYSKRKTLRSRNLKILTALIATCIAIAITLRSPNSGGEVLSKAHKTAKKIKSLTKPDTHHPRPKIYLNLVAIQKDCLRPPNPKDWNKGACKDKKFAIKKVFEEKDKISVYYTPDYSGAVIKSEAKSDTSILSVELRPEAFSAFMKEGSQKISFCVFTKQLQRKCDSVQLVDQLSQQKVNSYENETVLGVFLRFDKAGQYWGAKVIDLAKA